MAWVRRLPSGLWAATVYLPTGKRVTESHQSAGVIRAWARDLESDISAGDWIDPRAGKTTVGELWDRYAGNRSVASASQRRDESHYRVWVEPHWGSVPVGGILKPDVVAWIAGMEKRKTDGRDDPVGGWTVMGALGVLRMLLETAVDARLIRFNPAKGVKVRRPAAHLDRTLADDEEHVLLANLDAKFPGRADARLMCEALLYCGLRWEEAAALDRDHLDMRKRRIKVGPVMEKGGVIRPFPKSPAGVREVGVDDDLWPRLRDHALRVAPGGLLFTAPNGGPLHYDNWSKRTWKPGLLDAEGWAILDDPQPTPHDLRHTYGTRLGEANVPPHEIMALMGHADLKSVQRYLHAREERFERARQAMLRSRTVSN